PTNAPRSVSRTGRGRVLVDRVAFSTSRTLPEVSVFKSLRRFSWETVSASEPDLRSWFIAASIEAFDTDARQLGYAFATAFASAIAAAELSRVALNAIVVADFVTLTDDFRSRPVPTPGCFLAA